MATLVLKGTTVNAGADHQVTYTPTAIGNLLLVYADNTNVTTISDNRSVGFQLVAQGTGAFSGKVWWGLSTSLSSLTVTVNGNTGSNNRIRIVEYSNEASSSPIDTGNYTSIAAATLTLTPTAIATSFTNETLVAFVEVSGAYTTTSGQTQDASNAVSGALLVLLRLDEAAMGSYAPGGTAATNTFGAVIMLVAVKTTSSTSGPAATPTFSPVAGTYTGTQNVTISSTTPGASIFYTTDGSTPTPSSTPYVGPVAVASSLTLKAVATATGFDTSAVGSAAYTINSATHSGNLGFRFSFNF